MITEKDTIKCEAIFNDDRTHRFSWKRVWDKDKPTATVIMLNPCMADNIITDTTTALVVNNVAKLEEYGGVIIVNIYSLLTNKLNFRWNSDEDLNAEENDSFILKAAEESKTVILAWGKSVETNQRIEERAVQVINLLEPFQDKLALLTDGFKTSIHPLCPSLRKCWHLVPFQAQKETSASPEDNEAKETDFEVVGE